MRVFAQRAEHAAADLRQAIGQERPDALAVDVNAWGAAAAAEASDPPGWLERLDRPVVLVTTSSEFQDDHRLVKAALEALADEPVAVVATLPAGDPPAVRVPANARIERFLPHGLVLDRSLCAVTHGGMGATQKALAHGVPVCAVPFGRDQLEVARRVEVAGAGTRLPARRLRPDRLRAKVHDPGGLRRRGWAECCRRSIRDPPAEGAVTAEATVLTGAGRFSSLPVLQPPLLGYMRGSPHSRS